MITVQLNLYIFIYNNYSGDFDIVSINAEKLEVPNLVIEDNQKSIRQYLDSLVKTAIIDYEPSAYRLLNNLIIDSVYHSIYFCVIPNNVQYNKNSHLLPVKKYGIHSPNIQQILQSIR